MHSCGATRRGAVREIFAVGLLQELRGLRLPGGHGLVSELLPLVQAGEACLIRAKHGVNTGG